MNDQVTNQDILEAINESSSQVQAQLDSMGGRLDSMEKQMATKQDLRQFEQKIIDKMSDGFADMEGFVVSRQRKGDQKVNLILDILERHKVAPKEEIERVRRIRLFPQAPEVSS